jgi:transposase-like protein
LQALLGPDAPGLSPATLSRLKQGWQDELAQWQQRDLTGKRYVYFWVDGVYLETRLEDTRHCLLVIIGADASGQKELVGLWDGYRESEQSWKELLLDLKTDFSVSLLGGATTQRNRIRAMKVFEI